jgi:hypothetical protein
MVNTPIIHMIKKIPFLKIYLAIVAFSILLLVFVLLWRNSITYTVSQGEQYIGIGSSYGYKIENYQFSNRMRITIWMKMGFTDTMKSVYDLPSLTVEKVSQAQWIKSNGAIYLELQIKHHDSLESIEPTKIIYDYHKGEMYVTSNLILWRMWNSKLSFNDWMTESEFDRILSQLR